MTLTGAAALTKRRRTTAETTNSALTASEKTAKNKTPGRIRMRKMIGIRRIRLLTVRAAPAAMPVKTMSSAIAARKVFFRTMILKICGRIFSRRPTRLWGAKAARIRRISVRGSRAAMISRETMSPMMLRLDRRATTIPMTAVRTAARSGRGFLPNWTGSAINLRKTISVSSSAVKAVPATAAMAVAATAAVSSGARAGGFSVSVLAVCAVIGWSVSGFYIVPEGQTGVVTTFGAYSKSTMPGINWHLPAPIQDVELVDVSSVRTAEIGMRGTTDRLREALMLTDDENIVDVQFNVQYRIKPETGAKDYLFNTRAPDASVTQAAESAMREVVGRKAMDSVLFESKAEIAEAVRNSMQAMLDRYSTGIEVMSVAIQNAQPPQQVQAAFNDAVKAGQDRERQINLGEAYMNAVIPKAQGTASRLKEEAEGYKARVVETARGDADRFTSVYTEYAKAPQVTRDRIYVDAMRDIYQNVTKVYVDQKSGSNLLYLPLDKIVASTQAAAKSEADSAVPTSSAAAASTSAPNTAGTNSAGSATYSTDIDPREMIRSRLR